ncbi:MAG: tetratricopeptide repeat protein [Prevotella sp.]|nr:tetratricopeptide repeat protein [Prevotella sp.]
MDLLELIQHPERMDRDTLYELRSQVALYPYHQTLRLLMLHNLYLLHDPGFDEELRRAAIYITDRSVLFNMVEAAHYKLRPEANGHHKPQTSDLNLQPSTLRPQPSESRTSELIDSFLDSIPQEEPQTRKRKPTPADAAIDYVAYLLDTEGGAPEEELEPVPEMRGQQLIDTFINSDKGRFTLSDVPLPAEDTPAEPKEPEEEVGEEYFTETLARIYIKQGRYSKALEIIRRLSLQVPKKNAYFADQIRFLEKVIINNSKK